ncbi:MAG: flagellar motor switch protein FliG [Thermacetogeniaceae bacterium]|jgi:flagellar motor switch protein FliG|nr:flagellar motor switch protein FliG [Thermoanaerobacterales bacterium]NLN21257.1 flagellar motor switch protein FliG [Syntrophomonadaceae bacterium]
MKLLTGRQKAAILLITLGPELSSQIFKHLPDSEVEKLTLEIANIRKVSPEKRDQVFQEFYELALANDYISQGGIDYAKELLEKAYGEEKAAEIIGRLTANLQVRPFDFARKTDPGQLLNFIQYEHPQTIALIMAYLDTEQASAVLSSLPAELQVDVARRLALMESTSPEILREVENILEHKLSTVVTQDYTQAGGVETLVAVLNRVDRATEKTIIETLEVQDPELAEEIKKLLFVFEDIVQLDDRAVQLVLRQVDSHDLALALKGSGEEVMNKIKRNISKRAAQMLQEEIDYMGPVRLRDVEEAQQKIVAEIRRLEEQGQIIITRGGRDEIIL